MVTPTVYTTRHCAGILTTWMTVNKIPGRHDPGIAPYFFKDCTQPLTMTYGNRPGYNCSILQYVGAQEVV